MQSFAYPDDLQGWPDGIREVLRYPGDESIGVTHVNHHGAENVAVVDQSFGFLQGYAAALAKPEEFEHVRLAMLRGEGINDLHAFETHTEFAGASLDIGDISQQNRIAN